MHNVKLNKLYPLIYNATLIDVKSAKQFSGHFDIKSRSRNACQTDNQNTKV